jgi:aminocarboxymuconate-semialdehyde decarboxylase
MADKPRTLRIDVHTHILPESWPDLKARYGYGGWLRIEHGCTGKARLFKDDGTPFRDISDNCWSLERRLRDCDGIGIQTHVLSTVPVMFSYGARPEDTLDLSVMLNDHLAACVATNPQRFVGLGTLPMQSPALACQELRRCVQQLGLAGVQIGTHVNDTTLDAEELFPVFKLAEELGACIFIHPWDMRGGSLLSRYWSSWLVDMPALTCAAMTHMIFGGIFERCAGGGCVTLPLAGILPVLSWYPS